MPLQAISNEGHPLAPGVVFDIPLWPEAVEILCSRLTEYQGRVVRDAIKEYSGTVYECRC